MHALIFDSGVYLPPDAFPSVDPVDDDILAYILGGYIAVIILAIAAAFVLFFLLRRVSPASPSSRAGLWEQPDGVITFLPSDGPALREARDHMDAIRRQIFACGVEPLAPWRAQLSEPDHILAVMAADSAALRRTRGHLDFADLADMGWTQRQIAYFGRSAAIDAIRCYALKHDSLAPLDPADAGLATICATLLPPDFDLADEPTLLSFLHHAGLSLQSIQQLAPFVVAKALDLRSFNAAENHRALERAS